jgi:hypothetical protein
MRFSAIKTIYIVVALAAAAAAVVFQLWPLLLIAVAPILLFFTKRGTR